MPRRVRRKPTMRNKRAKAKEPTMPPIITRMLASAPSARCAKIESTSRKTGMGEKSPLRVGPRWVATLRPEAVGFAREEIRRRKWRGKRGGVLPDGYDAEAVANQAIQEMLEG